ncbi:TRAP transporter substrate-binding protein [Candidatus Kaiserbacteria bacterium]|nr:TRAP transporter substrate-binding protein [Candidatus Kaiserbacteria bacterium]
MGMMTRASTWYGLGVCVLILIAIFALPRTPSKASAETNPAPIHVRWLLSHQPVDLFARATQVFADELEKGSNGEMILEVVTPDSIGYKKGDVPNAEILKQLNSGDVQIASAYTVALGHQDPEMWALTLPHLFKSYDSMMPVLDGAVGRQILDSYSAASTAHALAFTMSGGYRIIATKKTSIANLGDMKGLRIATSGGPVAEATLKALGAIPVSLDLENGSQTLDTKSVDGVETTYSRLAEVLGSQTEYIKYINETNHSMFLTAILASDNFYDSLSPQNRKVLENAALAAAQVERQDSIALAKQVKSQLEARGSVVSTLSSQAQNAFKAATQSVYAQLSSLVGADIVKGILDGQK